MLVVVALVATLLGPVVCRAEWEQPVDHRSNANYVAPRKAGRQATKDALRRPGASARHGGGGSDRDSDHDGIPNGRDSDDDGNGIDDDVE